MPSDLTMDNTRDTGGNPLETPLSQETQNLIQVIDGDTVDIAGERHRVKFVDTEESVHPTESRNTEKGRQTSKFMKDIIPSDSDVIATGNTQDHYGRNLSQVTRIVNGVEVDWGLVVMDNELSQYETKYGTAPDNWHEVYKQYYSKYAPYEYDSIQEPLEPETLSRMASLEQMFKAAYTTYEDNPTPETRKDLDLTLAAFYGNPQDVARYRQATAQQRRKANASNSGLAAAYQLAEQDPTFRELYNKAVRQGSLPRNSVGIPRNPQSFWERLGATYEQMSVLSNLQDKFELDRARAIKDVSIPLDDIKALVPEQYKAAVEQQYHKHGAAGAYTYAEQLAVDIANNRVFDSLPLHKQLGYGAVAIIADPSSWMTGGLMAKGATTAITAASKLPTFAKGTVLHTPMQISTWGAAAGLEGALYDAPRFSEGDLTYTGTHYLATIAMSTAFGSALSGVLIGGGKWMDSRELKKSQQNFTKELNDSLKAIEQPKDTSQGKAKVLEALQQLGDKLVETEQRVFQNRVPDPQDLADVATIKQDMQILEKATTDETIGQAFKQMLSPQTRTILESTSTPQQTAPVKVADLFEVDSLDRNMFNNVLNVARKQMDNNGDLFQFLKRQAGLNKYAEESGDKFLIAEANKLNATLTKLVSVFPDGKIPYEYRSVLAELRMGQQRWVTNNALADIIDSPNAMAQIDNLQRYVNKLKEMDLWLDGIKPEPMSWLELAQYAPNMVEMIKTVDGQRIIETPNLPADVKFLQDVVMLNNQARASGDINFVKLVDELNGMVANRLMQKELGTAIHPTMKTTDKTKWFPKKIKRSPVDVQKALKESGIEQFTPEYKAAREEMRTRLNKILAEQNPTPKQAENARKIAAGRLEAKVKSGEITKHNPEWLEAKKRFEEGYEYLPDEIREVGKQDITKFAAKTIEDDARAGRNDEIMQSDNTKTGDFVNDTRVDVAGDYGGYGFDAGAKTKHEFDFRDPMGETTDLLPRKINEPVKMYAYDTKDAGQVKYLNEQLNKRVLSKLQGLVDRSNKLRKNEQEVMNRVVSNLSKDTNRTIKTAVDSGKLDYVFAVIRASETLARKQRAEQAAKATKEVEGVSETTPNPYEGKPLKEEDVAKVVNKSDELTPEQHRYLSQQMHKAHELALEQKVMEIQQKLHDFEVAELPSFKAAIGLSGKLDWLGRKLSFMTKDIATKLQENSNPAMSYIGFKVTELGRGFGGNAQRGATGGLIKHRVLTDLQMDLMPSYVKAMKDYAASKGSNMLETLNAQQMTGYHNTLVKQFNEEFFWLQEMRRMGHELPANVKERLQHVVKFADEWDKMMDKAHKYLVDSRIEGFTKERKVKHYVPRVHKYGNYKRAIEQHGLPQVQEVIFRSIRSADPKISTIDANQKASEFIDWVMKQDGTTPVEDLFMPQADTRSMARMPLDMTVEYNGIRMMDLVNTEAMELGMKYTNRVAGWVGLSDSTGGMLNSNLAIDAYRAIVQEAPEGKVLFDDVINLMFGRPTRNGLAEEIRHFKDLTALTRMGGLGTAQLVESGNVITKGVMNLFSDPKVAKRLFEVAKSDHNDKALLSEIQAISRLTDDMEWLQRQSVNLEQSENIGMQPWRKHSIKLADTMTFGKFKAPASRLLGKVSGFNAVRRFQSRVAQTGFTLNAIKHFTDGSSAISPKRLADLGLTDVNGKNDALQAAIKQFVEIGDDGLATKLNFDKWPKEVRDQFTYALLRDEAQQVQKSLVGELPAWYNKPLMALAFQFRQFPIVAQNKQLGRALAMADKEAVVATLLNAATAGLVRTAKAATVAGGIAAVSSREYRFNSDPEHRIRDASKYVAQFGVLADATDFVTKAYQSYDDDGFSTDLGDTLLSFAPIWGLMKDYKDLANPNSSNRERVDATFGVVPLGNVILADMIRAQAQDALAE